MYLSIAHNHLNKKDRLSQYVKWQYCLLKYSTQLQTKSEQICIAQITNACKSNYNNAFSQKL